MLPLTMFGLQQLANKIQMVQVLQDFHTLLAKQDHKPFTVRPGMMVRSAPGTAGRPSFSRDYHKYDLLQTNALPTLPRV